MKRKSIKTRKQIKQKKTEKPEESDFYFTIYPKTDKDLAIAGLKNAIKASKTKPLDVFQLKKFLLQHILEKYKDKDTDLFDKREVGFSKILLSIKDKVLEDQETLEELKKKNRDVTSFILYYELLFKR